VFCTLTFLLHIFYFYNVNIASLGKENNEASVFFMPYLPRSDQLRYSHNIDANPDKNTSIDQAISQYASQ